MPATQAYFALYESTSWNQKYQKTPEEIIQGLSQSWYFVQAYHKEALVGTGRIISDGVMYAMIYDLIVTSDYREKGIAGEILNRLIKKALEKNILNIQLFSADQKMPFYEKRGFVARDASAAGMALDINKWRNMNA